MKDYINLLNIKLLMSSILRIKNASHFEFFTQSDFSITAYTKERLKLSAFPDMRIKHRLMWNKLPSGRAYSMLAKMEINF